MLVILWLYPSIKSKCTYVLLFELGFCVVDHRGINAWKGSVTPFTFLEVLQIGLSGSAQIRRNCSLCNLSRNMFLYLSLLLATVGHGSILFLLEKILRLLMKEFEKILIYFLISKSVGGGAAFAKRFWAPRPDLTSTYVHVCLPACIFVWLLCSVGPFFFSQMTANWQPFAQGRNRVWWS